MKLADGLNGLNLSSALNNSYILSFSADTNWRVALIYSSSENIICPAISAKELMDHGSWRLRISFLRSLLPVIA